MKDIDVKDVPPNIPDALTQEKQRRYHNHDAVVSSSYSFSQVDTLHCV